MDALNKKLAELAYQPVALQMRSDGAAVEIHGTLASKWGCDSFGRLNIDPGSESNNWVVSSTGTLAHFETRHVAGIVGSYIRLERE
mgnify:CR=1 FL=1|jgi:hypothetical protein|tara:strand:- start:2669 stop:2926 length:258 start_codon:yes stop_codon:yes gene_type:complete